MTPLREAIVLPAMFLTVALLGGLRIAATVTLLPPSLTALVLAVLLLGTLVRGGVLIPQALMSSARSGIENASGAIVLVTLFAASAQAINLLLPERGLLHAAFAIFFFCQIMTMNASGAGRQATLRGLLILLGSLFVLRYIIIEALYAPDGGLLQRVLTTLMSGATLGGIAYNPNSPATGYVAFCTLTLYVTGATLLPSTVPSTSLMKPPPSTSSTLPTAVAILIAVGIGCRAAPSKTHGSSQQTASVARLVTAAQREDALRRAQVWRPPPPIGQADLKSNPAGSFSETGDVECRLVVKPMHGTTPKFDCERPDGDVVRIKYGRGNPELHAEVAATRLLSALGFGADRMYVVNRIRCAGCSIIPFHSLTCFAKTGLERLCFPRGIDYSHSTDFPDAVVERRFEGWSIQTSADEGWAWFELEHIDPARGGAPRAHIDALRLLAVMIAHWDNKSPNQRLMCLPGGETPDGGCARPFAIVQDVGATFGPAKLDLRNWRAMPVWADARTCRISMEKLPWGGGTFPQQQISEEGRRFLLNLLDQLSTGQLKDLFSGARIGTSESILAEARNPAAWVTTFQDKVTQIRNAGPCESRIIPNPESIPHLINDSR